MPDSGVDSGAVLTPSKTTGPRLMTVAAAAVATAAIWLVAHVAFGVDLEVKSGNSVQAVALPAVIVVTVFAGLAAWALLAILERTTSSPRPIFLAVGLVVLLFSLAGPAAGTTAAAKVVLTCEHLAAALVVVLGLARTVKNR